MCLGDETKIRLLFIIKQKKEEYRNDYSRRLEYIDLSWCQVD